MLLLFAIAQDHEGSHEHHSGSYFLFSKGAKKDKYIFFLFG